jgi:hypothetical protein
MKSLNLLLKTISDALTSIEGAKVYHYHKPEAIKAPYIIWAEDGEGDSFHSGNHKSEQLIQGVVDYYTLREFDATVDLIQAALNGVCAFSLDSVQYEDETKLIHYHWTFEVY